MCWISPLKTSSNWNSPKVSNFIWFCSITGLTGIDPWKLISPRSPVSHQISLFPPRKLLLWWYLSILFHRETARQEHVFSQSHIEFWLFCAGVRFSFIFSRFFFFGSSLQTFWSQPLLIPLIPEGKVCCTFTAVLLSGNPCHAMTLVSEVKGTRVVLPLLE